MATMKAVEVQEPGGPLRLVQRQVPLPAPMRFESRCRRAESVTAMS